MTFIDGKIISQSKGRVIFYRIVIILVMLVCTSSFAQNKRPKIGLVLSGGGARGLAHIGILKLIDSLQITIDYIVGTSMGGIVGGLYAAGYSGNEIEKYVLNSDWSEMFLDQPPRERVPYLQKKDDGKFQVELGLKDFTPVIPSGLIYGQNVLLKFSDLTSAFASIEDFDELPIPFRCIAVDLITGNEVVLKQGSLAKAMRATMAIPTVFSPVEWGDSLLIDGGILNNFPADILKQMGAEIIIGVNVGSTLMKKSDLNSIVSILEQTMVLTDYARQNENSKYCDLLIRPELEGYSSADFDAERISEIVRIGNECARINKTKLIEIRKKLEGKIINSALINSLLMDGTQIGTIILSGNHSYNPEYFYELMNLKPNDSLNATKLNDAISKIKTTGIFDSVDVHVFSREGNTVNLWIRVNEHKKPQIFGITVTGNEELSFEFINQLLGLKPAEIFDKEKLNERINEMYGLGYFEEVTYSISPVRDNYIRLHLNVKEKSLRKLKIGFRYDDEYKLVGLLGLQATNILIPGLRSEIYFQFAGLLKFDWILCYPSRTLDKPIFPYLRVAYKNVPIKIFNLETGKNISEYDDKSWLLAAGIGFNMGTIGNLKLEYNHEYMNITPNYEGLDNNFFESWKDKLRKLRAELAIDLLDDVITPQKGIKIDAEWDICLKALGSEIEYHQYQAEATVYKTIADKHTLRLNGYYTNFLHDLPTYKYPFKGGADSFVGLGVNQLAGDKYGYIRFDYIYKYKKDILLKLIFNACTFNIHDYFELGNASKPMYGVGIGVKFLSIVGPFEVIISRGSKSPVQWNNFTTRIYFTAGYKF